MKNMPLHSVREVFQAAEPHGVSPSIGRHLPAKSSGRFSVRPLCSPFYPWVGRNILRLLDKAGVNHINHGFPFLCRGAAAFSAVVADRPNILTIRLRRPEPTSP